MRARLAEYGLPNACTTKNEHEVALLGGRLSDLEVLLQKIRSGATLDAAVDDIVTSVSTVSSPRTEGCSSSADVLRPLLSHSRSDLGSEEERQ